MSFLGRSSPVRIFGRRVVGRCQGFHVQSIFILARSTELDRRGHIRISCFTEDCQVDYGRLLYLPGLDRLNLIFCLYQINDTDPELMSFVTDANKFIITFKDLISQSAPHIYLSALPFSPAESKISKHFLPQFPHTLTVHTSEEMHWPENSHRLDGHADAVSAVAVSKDGNFIASGSLDRTVRIWDAQTGDLVSGPFEGHTERVTFITFSQDGSHLISGSDEQTIRIWNRDTGEVITQSHKAENAQMSHFVLSPDATHVLSASLDHVSVVREVQSGQQVAGPWRVHSGIIQSIVFSPDGKLVASGSMDKTIRIFDVQTGEP